MSKKCANCGQPIPEGRLKALPKTTTCTGCSSTGKVAGFTVISGKNEYADLQIVDPETSARLNKAQNRIGYGVSEGIKFDSDKEGGSNGI